MIVQPVAATLVNAANQTINAALVKAVNVQNLIPGSTNEYRFGYGLHSLNGLRDYTKRLIPPVLPQTGPQVFSPGFVTLPLGNNDGLVTPYRDTTEQTVIICFQNNLSTANTMIFGNLTTTTGDGGLGTFYNLATGTYRSIVRGISGTGIDASVPAAISPSQFLIFSIRKGLTLDAGSPGVIIRVYNATQGGSEVTTAGTPTLAAGAEASPYPNYVLGSGYYSNGYGAQPVNVAYLGFMPYAMTDTDLYTAEQLIRTDCLLRGVPVF